VRAASEKIQSSTALIWHERFDGRGFSPIARSWPRYALGYDLLRRTGLLEQLRLVRPEPARRRELLTVHSEAYLDHLLAGDRAGKGLLDYGDTPAWRGVYRRARLVAGGSLAMADLVGRGEVAHAFNPAGGLHHARRDRAAGFCPVNDIVLALRRLQRRYGFVRPAVLDVDGHHGDGTQELLYEEPLLTLSLHQFDGRFYPKTGRIEELGSGKGTGYHLNVPMPRGAGDRAYAEALLRVVRPALEAYRPDVLLLQFGVDAHALDPLVGLRLTTKSYRAIARLAHRAAHQLCDGRLLVFSGGGYRPDAAVRCWAILIAELTGMEPSVPVDDELGDEAPEESQILEQALSTIDAAERVFFGPGSPLGRPLA
jgi:acetoin utilization protein AcuC